MSTAVAPASDRAIEFVAYTMPNPKVLILTATAAAGSIYGAITQENAVAIGLALVALGGVVGPPLGKAFKWVLKAGRDNNVASLKAFGALVAEVQKEAVSAKADADRLQGELAKAQERIELLQRQNTAQAAEMERMADNMKALNTNQGRIAVAVNKQAAAVRDVKSQVEQVVGSNSGINLPATGGDTNVDMPTQGG